MMTPFSLFHHIPDITHGVANDFSRKAVILIVVEAWWCAHVENMSHYEANAQAARQVDNALKTAPGGISACRPPTS
jgi:hypothetical protein